MITHVMFVLDQHGFANINHTTITHVRCIVQNTDHTLLLVVTVTYELACLESLFLYILQLNFVLVLASISSDLSQCEIRGSVLQIVDNIP